MSKFDFEDIDVSRSMSLLSTLSAAVEVVASMRERRYGRDPSEQQSIEVVVPALEEDVYELSAQLMALQTSCVAAERESVDGIRLVRHLNDLLLLGGVAHRLHEMHQRLMSLFPHVSEDLVEGARLVLTACIELRGQDYGTVSTTLQFIDEITQFLEWCRREIKLLSL